MRRIIKGFEILYHPPTGFIRIRRVAEPFQCFRFFLTDTEDYLEFARQKISILEAQGV